MHTIPFEIQLPKNEADFERMCAQVYGVVFDDRMPKMNGRSGQAQGGVDVFVKEPGVGRVGIQCKKYALKPLKWTDVVAEVEKADTQKTAIKKLILATTAPNDAALLKNVHELSDDREANGLFPVEVDFWEDICNHISRYPRLQDSYAPQTPGAAYHRQEASINSIRELAVEANSKLLEFTGLPIARQDSANRLISDQLDRINKLLKANLYRDALNQLAVVGNDLAPFDAHQKARWYLQKGFGLWCMGEDEGKAAELFLKSYETFPDDERMCAAHIRGLMLLKNLDKALVEGELAQERYPESEHVWCALANVRLLLGLPFQEYDIPASLKNDADALQFVAEAKLKAGHLEEAVRFSQKAATHPEAGFFGRANALRIATIYGTRFPVRAMAESIPLDEKKALEFAIELFQPRHERLWKVQTTSIVGAIGHLGFSLLVLHRFAEAISLVEEAEAHGYISEEILHTKIAALFALEKKEELLTMTAQKMSDLGLNSLAIVGQFAANEGKLSLLQQTLDAALLFNPADDETIELLTALRWQTLAWTGAQDLAVKEVLSAKADTHGGLIAACLAARILTRAGRHLDAEPMVERARQLVSAHGTEPQKYMLAETLFYVGKYSEAAVYFEQLITPGYLSDLDNRLLACYIRSQNRRKAKEQLSRLPAEWIEHDKTRSLAIELGHQVADWNFLRPLAETQLRLYPNLARSWLFKLTTGLHTATPAEFQNDLRRVPELLDGPIESVAQMARFEFRYGELERAMRRLYRMLRHNLDEPEALSSYFLAIVSAAKELPFMEEELPTVIPGSRVTLVDEFGNLTKYVIDPSDVGELPKRDGYSDTHSDQATALIGSQVGQEVELPALAFGGKNRYQVIGIQSAYRHMMEVVHERSKVMGGLPDMKMIPVRKDSDGELDLVHMKAEVLRSSSATRQLLDDYASGRMTLGGLCYIRSRSVTEAVLGWPLDAPSIYVGTGTPEEREKAAEVIKNPDECYVIDTMTLAEFVHLEVQEALQHLPRLFVSTLTKTSLERCLLEAEADQSVATSTEIDGQLVFIEHDARYHARRIQFFKETLGVIERYCEVKPAYGELDDTALLTQLIEKLHPEEVEVMMLARASNAIVLTLDGRFREILESAAKVSGIWPQAVLMHCAANNLLDSKKISSATVKQFLLNRSFVSLSGNDLVWMALQGGTLLQQGMQRFKKYLSSTSTEFTSAAAVAFSFLTQISSHNISLRAFGELFEHVMEASMRHPQCPQSFEQDIDEYFADFSESLKTQRYLYDSANWFPMQVVEAQKKYLVQSFARARRRLQEGDDGRPIGVRVLFCSRTPWLTADKTLKELVEWVDAPTPSFASDVGSSE